MSIVVFAIASFLINRAFKAQQQEDVRGLEHNISNRYVLFVESIRKEVKAKGNDRDVRNAVRWGDENRRRDVGRSAVNFDVFECRNTDGVLVLSKWENDPHIGQKDAELANAKTEPAFKAGKGTIRERIIGDDDEPQLVVEVTQWWDWGFVTGGRSLQKWLEGDLLSQPREHPIFLVKKKYEQEEWIPLNNIARKARDLQAAWTKQAQIKQAAGKSVKELVIALEDIPQQLDPDPEDVVLHESFTAVRADILSSPFSDTQQLPDVELIIAYSHQHRSQWQRRTLIILLSSLGAGGLILYGSSYLISRRITRPIAQLRQGVNEIGTGNLNYQIAIESKGEVGQLAASFNKMASELKQSIEMHKAAQRIATWQGIARQLAHEIKNPLFPIRLSVENLQSVKAQPEVFERIFDECTDTIIEEVDRIRNLVDEFHQFARLPVPDLRPVDLNDVVATALRLYAAPPVEGITASEVQSTSEVGITENVIEPAAKGVTVEKQLKPLPPLSLDKEQMERAVGNLVKNAIEAMPDGGTLTIRTYCTPLTENVAGNDALENSGHENGRNISLEVQDTGHGMSEETKRNLFTPDYTTKEYGSGLGMAIVRRIVTVHGGDIGVETEENIGTTIRINFNELSHVSDPTPTLISPETDLTPPEIDVQNRETDSGAAAPTTEV